jgi:leucyl aminopeptidase
MKSSVLLSLCTAALVAGAAHPVDPQAVLKESQPTFVEPDEYLIELSPGETRLVTEEGKWELRRVCSLFCMILGLIIVPSLWLFG